MTDSKIPLSESTLNFFLEEVLDSVKTAIVVLNTDCSINMINTGFPNVIIAVPLGVNLIVFTLRSQTYQNIWYCQ